jgi:hypothetical protein
MWPSRLLFGGHGAELKGIYNRSGHSENARQCGRVAELADAKDLGSFGAILAGSTPVAPTIL